jgi:hypothetical protein
LTLSVGRVIFAFAQNQHLKEMRRGGATILTNSDVLFRSRFRNHKQPSLADA